MQSENVVKFMLSLLKPVLKENGLLKHIKGVLIYTWLPFSFYSSNPQTSIAPKFVAFNSNNEFMFHTFGLVLCFYYFNCAEE